MALQLVLLGAEAEVLDAVMVSMRTLRACCNAGSSWSRTGDLQADVGEAVVRDAAGIAGGAEAHPGRVERHIEREVLALEGPIAAPAPAFAAGRAGLRFLRMLLGLLPLLPVLLAFVVGEHAHDRERLAVEVDDLADAG